MILSKLTFFRVSFDAKFTLFMASFDAKFTLFVASFDIFPAAKVLLFFELCKKKCDFFAESRIFDVNVNEKL